MTNYRRGIAKERELQKLLEESGYETMRTAGSHGLFDVIAFGPNVRCIQVKRVERGNSWKREYELAKERLEQLRQFDGVSYEIWVWEDYVGWVKRGPIQ